MVNDHPSWDLVSNPTRSQSPIHGVCRLRRWVISCNYGCQPATVCGKILQRESPEILGWLNMLNPNFHPWFDRWKPCAEPSRRNKRSLPHCDSAFLGEVMACRRRMFWGYHGRLHIRKNYYYIAIIMGYYIITWGIIITYNYYSVFLLWAIGWCRRNWG